MNNLTVFVNDQPVFEYDRNSELDESRLNFLDKMDADMSHGVKIQGESIAGPSDRQRALFVAMNLIKGLQQENQAVIQASCAYLVNRMPVLVEVHANDQDGKVTIDFVEEKLN